MIIFVSNLTAGMEEALDRPKLLLDMVKPFYGKVGIEFFIHTFSPHYMEQMAHIKTWTKDLHLAFHGPFCFVEATSSPGTREYENFTQAYDQAFSLIRPFGPCHLVFHSNECFVRPEEKNKLQAQCLSNIEMLIPRAKSFGVTLLLENLALPSKGTPLFDMEEYISLFDRFPLADCLIDVGHLNVAGWDMETVIRRLAGRIKGYHLHDNDGTNDSHQRIGCGTIDYSRFFELYRTYTPHGDLTLEYGSNPLVTVDDIRRDIALISELAQG